MCAARIEQSCGPVPGSLGPIAGYPLQSVDGSPALPAAVGRPVRGRKPEPTAIRVLHGDRKATRPKGPPLSPSCPQEPRWIDLLPGRDSCTLRADCGRLWAALVPELDRHGVLARVDVVLVVDAVVCAARIRQCERLLSRGGLTVETERGVVKNPVTSIVAAYRTQLRSYVGELGLSPSSRSRLPWDVAEEDDGVFSELFS